MNSLGLPDCKVCLDATSFAAVLEAALASYYCWVEHQASSLIWFLCCTEATLSLAGTFIVVKLFITIIASKIVHVDCLFAERATEAAATILTNTVPSTVSALGQPNPLTCYAIPIFDDVLFVIL